MCFYFGIYLLQFLLFATVYFLCTDRCIVGLEGRFSHAMWMSSSISSTLGFRGTYPTTEGCYFANFTVMLQVGGVQRPPCDSACDSARACATLRARVRSACVCHTSRSRHPTQSCRSLTLQLYQRDPPVPFPPRTHHPVTTRHHPPPTTATSPPRHHTTDSSPTVIIRRSHTHCRQRRRGMGDGHRLIRSSPRRS